MNLKNFLKTFVGLVLLVLLVTWVSPLMVWTQLKGLPLDWLVLAGFSFVSIYLFRTWRFYLLLPGGSLSFWQLFRVVSVQSLANVILPARVGEVSYVFFLKRRQVSLVDSLSSLILARVFDLMALSVIFFLFLCFFDSQPKESDALIYTILLFFSFFVCCFLLTILLKEWIWFRIEGILFRIPFLNQRIKSLREVFFSFVAAFSSLSSLRRLLQAFAISLGVWTSAHIFGYLCMVKILHLPLTVPETVFVLSFLQLVGLLPIHPFGGIGTVDAAWAYAVSNFGVSTDLAISSALTAHILTYLFSLLFGLTACGTLISIRGMVRLSRGLRGNME